MTEQESETEGESTVVIKCVECGNIYPAEEPKSDKYRPVGTDGSCQCGSADFERAIFERFE